MLITFPEMHVFKRIRHQACFMTGICRIFLVGLLWQILYVSILRDDRRNNQLDDCTLEKTCG